MTTEELEKIFGQPISVYTDRDAIEDGLIVPVSIDDRVTRSVWNFLHENTPLGAEPPSCWPVEMMGWFRAGELTKAKAQRMIALHGLEAQQQYEKQIRDKKALALARGVIGTERTRAKKIYEENIDGGIHKVFPRVSLVTGEHLITGLANSLSDTQGLGPNTYTLWLLPNELGGVTLMFPEDY